MGEIINIEKIIEEIRTKIKEEGYEDDAEVFETLKKDMFVPPVYTKDAFIEELQMVNESAFVDFDIEIRTVWWKKNIKKLIKKAISFQLKPIVDSQNLYNMNVVNVMNLMYSYILESERKKKRLEKIINQLADQNEKLYFELKKLEERMK